MKLSPTGCDRGWHTEFFCSIQEFPFRVLTPARRALSRHDLAAGKRNRRHSRADRRRLQAPCWASVNSIDYDSVHTSYRHVLGRQIDDDRIQINARYGQGSFVSVKQRTVN